MKNKKKIVYGLIGITLFLLVAVGLTYAYWLVTRSQSERNVATTACLDISLSNEKNDITLTNQFPISDEDGLKLVPYEFTVTNNCNTSVDYQIALEALGNEEESIEPIALKIALDDDTMLLGVRPQINPTIDGAFESRRIGFSTLSPSGEEGDSDTHTLKLWIDENASISEMNKTFRSKISVAIGDIKTNKPGTLAYEIIQKHGGEDNIETLNISEDYNKIGLFKASDNYGDSYFFREVVDYGDNVSINNYVQFGTTGNELVGYRPVDVDKSKLTNDDIIRMEDIIFSNFGLCETMGRSEFEAWSSCSKVENIDVLYGEDGNGIYYDSRETCLQYEDNCDAFYAEAPANLYWRIVRINGDGSIKLALDIDRFINSDLISQYNKYLLEYGYYDLNSSDYLQKDESGKLIDSFIKSTLDSWYELNLEKKYSEYIADTIFCNFSLSEFNPALTYEINFICPNKSKAYTVNDLLRGNGLLSKPIGLLTMQDMVYTSVIDSISDLKMAFFSMSPIDSQKVYGEYIYAAGYKQSGSFNIAQEYHVDYRYSHTMYTLPVINLVKDVPFTGSGTIDDPYVIGE